MSPFITRRKSSLGRKIQNRGVHDARWTLRTQLLVVGALYRVVQEHLISLWALRNHRTTANANGDYFLPAVGLPRKQITPEDTILVIAAIGDNSYHVLVGDMQGTIHIVPSKRNQLERLA